MSKIIVIGANHAGTACINTILDNYKEHEVVVYDRNSNISFLGCGMALWIGGQIKGSEGLFYSSKEALESKGAKVHMNTEIDSIDFGSKTVKGHHADGSEFTDSYDKLVLATGSTPIVLDVPGKDLENVQFVKLFQHAQEVIDKLASDSSIKKVAVVGAGYIGVELAEAFERHHKEVTMIDFLPTVLGSYYDEPYRKMMEDNLKAHGIKLALGEKVTAYEGEGGKVKRVVTDKGTYEADMVVQCVGFRPNAPFEGPARFRNGAYQVDLCQKTSIDDVYAIGDCAVVQDNALGDWNYIALATNAVRSGVVAAHNVSGTKLPHIGVQGSNGICIYDLKMVSTGMTVERAQKSGIEVGYTDFAATQMPAFIEEKANPEVHLRIVYRKDDRRIVGAQMASEYDMHMGIHMFSLAIQEGVTIDKLALTDIFFLPHFNQPYNYITMAALTAK